MGLHIESDIADIVGQLGGSVERFSGKTILVAGGRGFLGSYFVHVFAYLNEHVLERPSRVLVLDSLITSHEGNPSGDGSPHAKFVVHNIIEPFICNEDVDCVIHVAGIASPYYYRKYPLETLEVATLGTKNMLNLARQHHAKFMFLSSSEIYGDPDPDHVPTPESYRGRVACVGPRACYDESKRLGETLTGIYHEEFGVATNTVRPFNVYGPGMKEKDYRVLANFASRIIGGRPLHIYGAGTQTRTYCYITDAMVGFMKVLMDGAAGAVYNIGSPGPEVSVLELVRRIEEVLGREVNIIHSAYPDSYPADEPSRRCPDITKARLQLGYEARVDLKEGLGRFLGWAETAYTGEE